MSEEEVYRRKNRPTIECLYCNRERNKRRPESYKAWRARYNRSYYQKNREQILENAQQYQLQTKIEVLSHYSGGTPQCAICGESNLKFLGLDHLNGGGKAHKREIGGAGQYVYLWARKNNYPPMFQVLCHNCNIKKSDKIGTSSAAVWKANLKQRVLSRYSGGTPKCKECDETDIRVLTIDHINGDGAEEKKKLGIGDGARFYAYLDKLELRDDLQVLCHNHNLGKRCLG